MKRIVFATVLAAFAAGILVYIYVTGPGKIDLQPVPTKVETAKVVTTAPAVSDMSLPMPSGLKGDPAKGGAFFMNNCFTCHGVNGDGNGPRAYFITPQPRNFLLETSRQRLNRPVLFEAITNGRLGTNMPAWGKVLSSQEIADVAEFVFQNFISAPQGDKGKHG